MILNVCENGDVLSVLRIVRLAINLVKIVVPILLIISLMLTYAGAITKNDKDILVTANKAAVKKGLAAVLIFLIPTFVGIIFSAIDKENKTYVSCINNATTENIEKAYQKYTESLIDGVKADLSEGNYLIAKQSLIKIKDPDKKEKYERELEEIKKYVDLKKKIDKKDDYSSYRDEINAIEDETIRNSLLNSLFGSGPTPKSEVSGYIHDPNNALYQNWKNFDGKSLYSVLEENGTSVEALDNSIMAAVDAVGVGTREAPVAAAFMLIETLAGYGYKINYDWGGKWYNIGVDGNWGTRITPLYCSSHPDPDRCNRTLIWKGFDCTGFVSWAMIQGFRSVDKGRNYQRLDNIPLSGQTTAICNIGDVLENSEHIVLVVGHDEPNKRYLVAESTGGGLKLSYYAYNNSRYYCRHVKFSN